MMEAITLPLQPWLLYYLHLLIRAGFASRLNSLVEHNDIALMIEACLFRRSRVSGTSPLGGAEFRRRDVCRAAIAGPGGRGRHLWWGRG